MPQRSTRTAKLDLRLTPEAKQTLVAAAAAAKQSISEFVLESAMVRAEETLADRTRFGLDASRWKSFLDVLDAPPRPLPQLERLFRERSVFEDGSFEMTDPLRIEKLRRDHAVAGFDCGREELNRFLVRFALANEQAGAAQTYVALAGEQVIGYYSLAVGEVTCAEAPERLVKGLARHPIPLMLLARMAVSIAWQKRGIGAGLLKDAMRRTLQAADIAGIRALAVHAKDEDARSFYEHFGFIPSPTDPLHLFILIKDLRRVLPR